LRQEDLAFQISLAYTVSFRPLLHSETLSQKKEKKRREEVSDRVIGLLEISFSSV
jgi:hypothetical protein